MPNNLQILLDGDILRYEIGFAAEAGWKAIALDDSLPPWDYVENFLLKRIEYIKQECQTDKDPILYITEGKTFRYSIAKKKPYKGQRVENKPWHFKNLTAYMVGVLGARVITEIEADDAIAIEHCSRTDTIICSRDKDLRQVPGWFYSWELGHQPSYGPTIIKQEGHLEPAEKNKLRGSGLPFFYSQLITGDQADNIPGLPGKGAVAAFKMLEGKDLAGMLEAVQQAYMDEYGDDWEEELTEQGRLCWLLRKPGQVWEIGTTE